MNEEDNLWLEELIAETDEIQARYEATKAAQAAE